MTDEMTPADCIKRANLAREIVGRDKEELAELTEADQGRGIYADEIRWARQRIANWTYIAELWEGRA